MRPGNQETVMPHSKLKEELRALVAEISEVDTIPDDASFKDLGIDSMMGVEFVAAIERQYQIKIDDGELEHIKTLVSSFDLVLKKLEAKQHLAATG
jgi:acyl carrier protein